MRKITREKIFRVFGLNINFKNTRSNCDFVKNLIDSRSKELEKLKGWEILDLKALFQDNNLNGSLNAAAHPNSQEIMRYKSEICKLDKINVSRYI